MQADRNLLWGILALQMDFIDRDALVAAMNAWVLDKRCSLGDILEERGSITSEMRQLLDALVDKHLEIHGCDTQRSLRALSSLDSARAHLQASIVDSDLHASLAQVGQDRQVAGDPYATDILSAGSISEVGGRFRILRPHARGGLGEVYVAKDVELNREVALKEIQAQYADDAESRARFLVEAEVTGGLEHPSIVPVYGLGTYGDGRPFYAMRFIRGDSLRDAIARFHSEASQQRPASERTLEFRKLLGRLIDVCQAIEYAHSRGVLHRDLKPGNIMLGKYGETLVVDWGLAKLVGREERSASLADEPTLRPASGSGSAPTQMGSAVGTPAYMSPEQAEGRLDLLGPASDVYSLGATLYTVLTGRAPIETERADEALAAARRGEFPRPRELDRTIPAALEAICLKAMRKEPADRYTSPSGLADDLEQWLGDEQVAAYKEPISQRLARWSRRHRRGVQAAVAALLAITVTAVMAALVVNHERAAAIYARDEAYRERQRTEKQRLLVVREKERADQNAADAQRRADEAERSQYIAQMRLVERAVASKDVTNARRILDNTPERFRGWEWFWASSETGQELHTLRGHSGFVMSVCFSPDCRRIVSASDDETLKLWDAETGEELRTFHGHAGTVASVCFSPDGRWIVSAGDDETLKLWDAETGEELRTFHGHSGFVMSVCFSPDGRWIVSTGDDATLKLWDTETGEELRTLTGHADLVTGVSFSPDGRRIVSASGDETLKLWDTETGEELRTLTGHAAMVTSVSFSPDGGRIVSASLDETLKLWNPETGEELRSFTGNRGMAWSVSFGPNGRRIVSGNIDGTLKIWDTETGDQLRDLIGHNDWVTSVSFSPDGRRVVSASHDNTIKLWSAETLAELRELSGHTDEVNDISFSPDGRKIVSASVDETLKLWDTESGEEIRTLGGHKGGVKSVAFSPRGRMIVSANSDNAITLWDAETGEELRTLGDDTDVVSDVSFSSDGRWIVSSSYGILKLWEAETGEELRTFGRELCMFTSPSFSPDRRWIVSGNYSDGTLTLWDTQTGEGLRTLNGHTGWVLSVCLSPDGRQIVSASDDKTLKLWDSETGQELRTLGGHTGDVNSVSFSPDGRRIVSASDDETLKLWDTETGEELRTLGGHKGGVNSVSFSPDGNLLAVATGSNVLVYDATPLNELSRNARLLAHEAIADHVAPAKIRESIEARVNWSPELREAVLRRVDALLLNKLNP